MIASMVRSVASWRGVSLVDSLAFQFRMNKFRMNNISDAARLARDKIGATKWKKPTGCVKSSFGKRKE